MMKNKLVLLLSLFLLASCGAKTDLIFPANLDHSTNWQDNYYTYWNDEYKDCKSNVVELDKKENKVFTSFFSPEYEELEPTKINYDYFDDITNIGFGPNFKSSKDNGNLKNGFVSKLFDGQIFCNGYYELARVQIKDSGFSYKFGNKLSSATYLALNFKNALDFKSAKPDRHLSDIKLNITLYKKENNEYIATTYACEIDNLLTNGGEIYTFYGFSLEGFDVSNVDGFSISYELLRDAYNDENDTKLDYSLMLYELIIGHATWKD